MKTYKVSQSMICNCKALLHTHVHASTCIIMVHAFADMQLSVNIICADLGLCDMHISVLSFLRSP